MSDNRSKIAWRKPTLQLIGESTPNLKRINANDGEPRSMNLSVNLDVKAAARMSVHDANALVRGAYRGHAEKYLPTRTYTIDIDYPMHMMARVTVYPYRNDRGHKHVTVGYLLAMLGRAYRRIYREPEKFGVWGHGIGDLTFAKIEVRDNIINVGVDS
jgi:hypothetical protein